MLGIILLILGQAITTIPITVTVVQSHRISLPNHTTIHVTTTSKDQPQVPPQIKQEKDKTIINF